MERRPSRAHQRPSEARQRALVGDPDHPVPSDRCGWLPDVAGSVTAGGVRRRPAGGASGVRISATFVHLELNTVEGGIVEVIRVVEMT